MLQYKMVPQMVSFITGIKQWTDLCLSRLGHSPLPLPFLSSKMLPLMCVYDTEIFVSSHCMQRWQRMTTKHLQGGSALRDHSADAGYLMLLHLLTKHLSSD